LGFRGGNPLCTPGVTALVEERFPMLVLRWNL
jgi:hypothetical protein